MYKEKLLFWICFNKYFKLGKYFIMKGYISDDYLRL